MELLVHNESHIFDICFRVGFHSNCGGEWLNRPIPVFKQFYRKGSHHQILVITAAHMGFHLQILPCIFGMRNKFQSIKALASKAIDLIENCEVIQYFPILFNFCNLFSLHVEVLNI